MMGQVGENASRYADELRRRHTALAGSTAGESAEDPEPATEPRETQAASWAQARGAPEEPLDDLLHQDEPPARPALAFSLALPPLLREGGPEPSQTTTEAGSEGAATRAQPDASPSPVDARSVADRVYDLAREEIRLARLRGVAPR
jgi:hypothetical protein